MWRASRFSVRQCGGQAGFQSGNVEGKPVFSQAMWRASRFSVRQCGGQAGFQSGNVEGKPVFSQAMWRASRFSVRQCGGQAGFQSGNVEGKPVFSQAMWRASRFSVRQCGGQAGFQSGNVEGKPVFSQAMWRASRFSVRQCGGQAGFQSSNVKGKPVFNQAMWRASRFSMQCEGQASFQCNVKGSQHRRYFLMRIPLGKERKELTLSNRALWYSTRATATCPAVVGNVSPSTKGCGQRAWPVLCKRTVQIVKFERLDVFQEWHVGLCFAICRFSGDDLASTIFITLSWSISKSFFYTNIYSTSRFLVVWSCSFLPCQGKFEYFQQLCCEAYNILRRHSNLLINLFAMVRYFRPIEIVLIFNRWWELCNGATCVIIFWPYSSLAIIGWKQQIVVCQNWWHCKITVELWSEHFVMAMCRHSLYNDEQMCWTFISSVPANVCLFFRFFFLFRSGLVML